MPTTNDPVVVLVLAVTFDILVVPSTHRLLAIPTPPATFKAPVIALVAGVVSWMVTSSETFRDPPIKLSLRTPSPPFTFKMPVVGLVEFVVKVVPTFKSSYISKPLARLLRVCPILRKPLPEFISTAGTEFDIVTEAPAVPATVIAVAPAAFVIVEAFKSSTFKLACVNDVVSVENVGSTVASLNSVHSLLLPSRINPLYFWPELL